jgi:hypothetical protein
MNMTVVSGVVELKDEEVLQFSEAANTMGKTRSDLNTWQAVSLIV